MDALVDNKYQISVNGEVFDVVVPVVRGWNGRSDTAFYRNQEVKIRLSDMCKRRWGPGELVPGHNGYHWQETPRPPVSRGPWRESERDSLNQILPHRAAASPV